MKFSFEGNLPSKYPFISLVFRHDEKSGFGNRRERTKASWKDEELKCPNDKCEFMDEKCKQMVVIFPIGDHTGGSLSLINHFLDRDSEALMRIN